MHVAFLPPVLHATWFSPNWHICRSFISTILTMEFEKFQLFQICHPTVSNVINFHSFQQWIPHVHCVLYTIQHSLYQEPNLQWNLICLNERQSKSITYNVCGYCRYWRQNFHLKNQGWWQLLCVCACVRTCAERRIFLSGSPGTCKVNWSRKEREK